MTTALPHCCWHQAAIQKEDCPYLRDGDETLLIDQKQRLLKRCLECPKFLEDLRAFDGELYGLPDMFTFAVEEILGLRASIRSLQNRYDSRSQEIKSLHDIGLALQTSVDRDEIIAMALTAVTSGKGFGLNRAILLLVDKDRQKLEGSFAVGPLEAEDAGRIWREIEAQNYSLQQMAQLFYEQKMVHEKEKFRELLGKLTVSLSQNDHLFIRTLNERKSVVIHDLFLNPDLPQEQKQALSVKELIMVPLVSKDRRIGLLLADNIINRRPIDPEDLESLETFALPLTFAIKRAALYERLQEELERVREANRRLNEQQEQILRMEKMALVGQIASNIAHSIRNPLTIIGGFARTLIKSVPEEDARRQYLESIVLQTRKLEDILQEVLHYSESLHPTLDDWDINQMIAAVYTGQREDLELSHVHCRLDLQPGLPLVRIDYKKMIYCLRNIIANAVEAMPDGGEISISTREEGDHLKISLQDSGSGIRPEMLNAVTQPFYSTKAQGSGLGLPLCARILEGQNAYLEIRSDSGQGTTINILIEIQREEHHGKDSDR